MIKNEFKTFKYKGKVFMLIESDLAFIPGRKFRKNGVELISINKNLPERKKQLALHKLITGRGLINLC